MSSSGRSGGRVASRTNAHLETSFGSTLRAGRRERFIGLEEEPEEALQVVRPSGARPAGERGHLRLRRLGH